MRWLWLILAMVIGVISFRSGSQLAMDRRLETMFRHDDAQRQDFEFLKETFGGNEVILCAFRIPEIWSTDGRGLTTLRKISGQLREVEGVQAVMDLSRLETMLEKTTLTLPANPSKEWLILSPDNAMAKALLELFSGYTHVPQGNTVAVACLLEPQSYSSSKRHQALESIATIVKNSDLQGVMIGEPVMIADGFRLIESDGRWLGIAVSIVLGALLLLGFRSIRWTIAAIAVVQWSLIVTQATLVWSHLEMTMVSTMLSSIVTIISVATTIHWMLGYQRALDLGLSSNEALTHSLLQLIRPIVWACVTDAVGFASLMVARVGPVRDYGLMMSIASMVVLLGIMLLIPGIIGIGRGWQGISHLPGDSWLGKKLMQSLQRLEPWRRWLWPGVWVVGILSVLGSQRIEVETDFIKNFRPNWPMVRAYEVVESELGGAGVWDVLIPAPPSLTHNYLQEIHAFEGKIRDLASPDGYRLSKVLSVADATRALQASTLAKLLPPDAQVALMRSTMPEFMDTLLQPAQDANQVRWLRVMLRSPEHTTAQEKLWLIQQVRQEAQALHQSPTFASHFASEPPQPKVTGHYVLLTSLVASLVEDQWRCFFVATFGVGAVLCLAVGNIRWVLIALIPNVLPAMVVLGGMGWLGWKINLGAALIAAVSIGISVDSSLHYLLSIQSQMKRGMSLSQAVDHTQRDVGMAMLVSTLALVLGFGWLASSQFLPTVAFGTTAALTMIGGLIGNLWLLPMLIKPRGQSEASEHSAKLS